MMAPHRSFRSVLTTNSILGALGVGVSALGSIIVFRTFTQVLFAEFSVALAVISIVNLVIEVGGSSSFSRYLGEARAAVAGASLFSELRRSRLILTLLVLPAIAILGPFYGAKTELEGLHRNPFLWVLIALVGASQIFAQLSFIGLQALFEHKAALLIKISFSLVRSFLLVAAALLVGTIEAVLLGLGLGYFVEMLCYNRLLLSIVGHEREPLPKEISSAAKRFGAVTIADKILVGFSTPSFVLLCIAPQYTAAGVAALGVAIEFSSRIISLASLPLSGVSQPYLNQAGDPEVLAQRGGFLLRLMALAYSGVVTIAAPLAPVVMLTIYGNQDALPWQLCQVVLISSVMDCFSRSSTTYLLRLGFYARVFVGDIILILTAAAGILASLFLPILSSVAVYGAVRSLFSLFWIVHLNHFYGSKGTVRAARLLGFAGLAAVFMLVIRWQFEVRALSGFDGLLILFGIIYLIWEGRVFQRDRMESLHHL